MRALLLTLALTGGALAQSNPAQQMGTPPGLQPSPGFTLSGALTGRSFTPADLQALPATNLTVTYRVNGQPQTHSYTGVLLSTLLTQAKPTFDPQVKNDALRYYVLARGSDGYTALISWGELDPGFGNRSVLVAYRQDGQPISGKEGALRLIVPGDVKGGRSVSALADIQLVRGGP